jgi:hypothetical protein
LGDRLSLSYFVVAGQVRFFVENTGALPSAVIIPPLPPNLPPRPSLLYCVAALFVIGNLLYSVFGKVEEEGQPEADTDVAASETGLAVAPVRAGAVEADPLWDIPLLMDL